MSKEKLPTALSKEEENKLYELVLGLQEFIWSRCIYMRGIVVSSRKYGWKDRYLGYPAFATGAEILPARLDTDFGPCRFVAEDEEDHD